MKELDIVVLKNDFKDLKVGTKGTIVHEYNDNEFEVEFVDDNGETIRVLTTPINILELVLPI